MHQNICSIIHVNCYLIKMGCIYISKCAMMRLSVKKGHGKLMALLFGSEGLSIIWSKQQYRVKYVFLRFATDAVLLWPFCWQHFQTAFLLCGNAYIMLCEGVGVWPPWCWNSSLPPLLPPPSLFFVLTRAHRHAHIAQLKCILILVLIVQLVFNNLRLIHGIAYHGKSQLHHDILIRHFCWEKFQL